MIPHNLKKVDYHIAIWGLIAIALTAVAGGISSGLSALTGAALGMGNWVVFRRLILGIAASGNQMGLGVFLALKFLAVVAVVTLLFTLTPVDPIAFTAGISALFLGISTCYFIHLTKKRTTSLGGDD